MRYEINDLIGAWDSEDNDKDTDCFVVELLALVVFFAVFADSAFLKIFKFSLLKKFE